MLAEQVDYVVGVDTHRDQHTLAVVAAPTGAVLAQTTVRTDARGYREALRFAARHAPRGRKKLRTAHRNHGETGRAEAGAEPSQRGRLRL